MAKKRGQPIHGWVNLDKPVGVSSARAVGIVRRVFNAAKAGHGGTLDPLASGVLPIALGEATKTVSYAMHGKKSYAFTVKWGAETTTDDAEGEIVTMVDNIPSRDVLEAVLPQFTGVIDQVPPIYSAIKIEGKRAYDLARRAAAGEGEAIPELAARPITIDALSITADDATTTTFEVAGGKGAYIRALARDIGRIVGSAGHVVMLRRLSVGPFAAPNAISLDFLESLAHSPAAFEHLHPVVSALDDIPAVPISEDEASRFRHGQTLAATSALAQERFATLLSGEVSIAVCGDTPVALVSLQDGEVRPVRVFNM